MQITSPRGDVYDFRIGADPEFFVQRYGKLVSAYGLIPGTKEHPHPVHRGAVQVDGMALEFNIDPADTYYEFEENMQTVLDSIIRMVPGYEVFVEPTFDRNGNIISHLGMLAGPVADFGAAYIEAQPREAKELGCNPDYNAYTGQANPRPEADTPFRTASGHVHIGWTQNVSVDDESHFEACRALTKSLDVWLGIPSLLWDKDERRRSLYGAAGAFRPKPYGMEYRVLSNKWINNPLLRKTVYYNTIEAIKSTFKDPEFGNTSFAGMTARDLIQCTDKNSEHYKIAITSALHCQGIRSPSYYRE